MAPRRSRKPVEKTNWSSAETAVLIDKVQEHPCLWMTTDPLYKNALFAMDVWMKLSLELHKGADDCKHKWSLVRGTFTTKLKEVRNSPSGTEAQRELAAARWEFWERMQFLRDFVKTAPTVDNSPTVQEIETSGSPEPEDLATETSTPDDSLVANHVTGSPSSSESIGIYNPKKLSSNKRGTDWTDSNDAIVKQLKAMQDDDRLDSNNSYKILESALIPKELTPEEKFGQYVTHQLMQVHEEQREKFMHHMRKTVHAYALELLDQLTFDLD